MGNTPKDGWGPEEVETHVDQTGPMTPIDQAAARLERQLPLARRQAVLPDGYASVHRAILRGFADRGRAPTLDELAGESPADTAKVVERLAKDDLVVIANGSVAGAYPFSSEPTPHRITIDGRVTYAMCSLDAVAIAAVFEREVRIESTCAVTHTPVRIHQSGGSILSAEPRNLRLGVRWIEPVGCAAHSMCREMVFLADAETAESWRGPDPESAGIFDLADGVVFGTRFFRPLLED